jgi:ABC-2 type transport system ATP-binding protein
MTAVTVENLRKEFPVKKSTTPRVALDNVSLRVEKGELFGLLGPNGGGKSTLFRILSTLLSPTSGRALVMDRDIEKEGDAARNALGVVFQHPSLDKKLTLGENLIHHGYLYGVRGPELKRRIEETSALLDVSDRLNDYVETLSGGLQRRGEIAKALLSEPQVLLMDEPSTGLDPGARRALQDALLALKKRGVTILLTTHLMEEADACDRLAILHHGKLVATGTPSELKARIGGDVVTIESEAPEEVARSLRDRFQVDAKVMEGLVRFEKKDGHSFIPALVEAFPGRLKSVRLGKPTLEDVFAKETGQGFWAEEEKGKSDE